MPVTLQSQVMVCEDVLVQDLSGEIVLLNLESEEYFGLDDIGTKIWGILTESGSLQAAYNTLLATYNVEPEHLQSDLLELVENLATHGLVKLLAAQEG